MAYIQLVGNHKSDDAPGKLGNTGEVVKTTRMKKAIAKTIPADLTNFYPKDCYGWAMNNRKYKYRIPASLQDEAEHDMVAKLENAHLAGMDLPWDFKPNDLLATYIPSRRTLAFAYATLSPGIMDNFRKACRMARLPQNWYQNIYTDTRIAWFLSNFWKTRITSMAGIAFIYANKHARRGSAPHLKLLTDMTGITTSPETPRTEININMPNMEKNITPSKGHKALTAGDEFDMEPE